MDKTNINYSMLIVYPEAFALGWRGATTRLLEFSKGLTSRGLRITMLSAREWISPDQSEQERLFTGEIIRTPFTGAYPWPFDSHRSLRRFYRGLWKIRGPKYYHENLALGWASRISEWAKSNWRTAPPHTIWAICTSNINGIIAGRILSKFFDCPLVLEFQDPPSGAGDRLFPTLEPLFEECLQESDVVVTVTKAYRKFLIDNYKLDPMKVVTLYLSFPEFPKSTKQKDNNESLTLLHIGSLYRGDNRNARSIIHALAIFLKGNPQCKGRIKLRLVGGGSGGLEAKRLAASLNIDETMECCKEVPYEKAIEEMDNADVLVVIQHDRFNMQIPGKLFQYLGRNKPILGIMKKDTEAAEIIRLSGCGLVIENDDINGIVRYFGYIWSNKDSLSTLFKPNVSYIMQFSTDRMIQECHRLLTNILERKQLKKLTKKVFCDV